ncbi:YgiQ family radical SAM protein [Porphyromonas gingivalis]|uniref:YgiQ family radical SAM protein n=1 Tax=Porphyromonas gingivalis TaxID=837 RepID=UPI000C1A5FEA|nr:YgiQ family radical SAM protein [Porphyromonas gingivalis]ATS10857.1 YgiQ family radical SAM protein [Porphyromonas gingivalis]
MAKHHPLTDWLPTSKKEMEAKGWDEVDVILFSGDAYVDHPSFGAAVVGRILEAEGLRMAIVPQPNWRDDLRDFRKLGRPRLFFGVSAGAMDSMVNKYTANRRLRSEDAYTPDRRSDMRPDYPTIVYTRILKELFPDVPVIVGGIEASLRRLTHYDYWQDKLLPGILYQSGADLLIYGMGELPLHEIAQRLIAGEPFDSLKSIRQIAYLVPKGKTPVPCENDRHLFSHEECLSDKRKQAQNFREIEIQSNRYEADRILQAVGDSTIVVNPPFPPMSTAQIDQSFDLPYTRLPHPRYKGKIISAYEMIKHSVNVHRGCFGGCAFCTISAHQGKFIASRSEASVLREVKEITEMEDFKGYLSDVGGPSANMYKMQGYDLSICKRCKKPSCIHPNVCPNLNADHRPLLDLLRRIDKNPKIKKSFIGSGVRMDLLLHNYKDKVLKKAADEYTEDLIVKHVSGRLKVAPEHSSDRVLNLMRKPPFRQFAEFTKRLQRINEAHGLRQQLIPYFISSHPGCTEEDMAELAILTKKLDFKLEQIQDFTPTPMTLATEMYYTGYHPYTLQPVYTAIKKEEKMRQHMFFFWYKREEADKIRRELHRIGRPDLIAKLFDRTTSSRNDRHTPPSTQPRKGKSKSRHS